MNIIFIMSILTSNKLTKNINLSEEISTNSKDSVVRIKDLKFNIDPKDIITVKDFKFKELMHYKMLDKFYNACTVKQIHNMIDIVNGNHLISLRFLDWFVTRYCCLYKLSIVVTNNNINESKFNINISYKAQLKSFRKKYFDPFRRNKKFYYTYGNTELSLLTTISQLNFFRWIINYDIISYTETNYRDIIKKLSYVNSFFKKSIIENTSDLIITSSDALILDNQTSDNQTSNTQISDLQTSCSNFSNKSNKIIVNSDKLKLISKYPVVLRNICLEL